MSRLRDEAGTIAGQPKPPFSPYRDAVKFALAQQLIILVLAALILDAGETGEICLSAALVFWIGFLIIRIRRRSRPTTIDLILIRAGYIPLCVLTWFVVHLIWHLRFPSLYR
jgi:hypothetical protein